MKTLYTNISDHIGQVKIEEAQAEIDRMNKQDPNRNWRADDSEFLYCYDETDEDVHNPATLSPGYVWITCTKEQN